MYGSNRTQYSASLQHKFEGVIYTHAIFGRLPSRLAPGMKALITFEITGLAVGNICNEITIETNAQHFHVPVRGNVI